MGSKGPAQEEMEYDLRVIRLPITIPPPDPGLTLQKPPEPLRAAFEAADTEFHRILDTIDPKYYHELAVPSHFTIDQAQAEGLRSDLSLKESFPGVLGPEVVVCGEGTYKVWIQAYPCG